MDPSRDGGDRTARRRAAGTVMCAVAQKMWSRCRPRAAKAGADGRSLRCPLDYLGVCGGSVPRVGANLDAVRAAACRISRAGT